ncbi:MAG: glycoside hydrolase, partial [Actinomycetota bacterium]|nr:glycoside hydrolase [Actinomycetota bacterium]
MTNSHAATDLQTLREGFAHPTSASRPMMRWWWFGPAVERTEILRELDAMAAAGFGGAELSVVYPLSEESDSYLSPTFLADLRFAAEAARDRGLRLDITLGSVWSFGGPQIVYYNYSRNLK